MNDTDKCTGTTTWSRQSQKSTIDFLLVNNAAYNICSRMQIDEKQEKFDLSDHNLIETTLKMDCDHINYQRRGEWENIEYYKTVSTFIDDSKLTYVKKIFTITDHHPEFSTRQELTHFN